jgi:GNAT superfamily N-acetyltransferase
MVSKGEVLRVSIVDNIDAVRHLLLKNWQESGANPDIPLDVDVEKYVIAERAGILRCYAAMIENKIVGYAVFVLSRHSQYKQTIYGSCDVIYVDRDVRSTMIGLDLIRHCEDALADEGVDIVQQCEPKGGTPLGKLLRFLGYAPKEVVWTKRITRQQRQAAA